MNSVIDLLMSHRSIRRFKDEPLGEGVVEKLIKAGQSASTSSYMQATTVIRVTDDALRNQFVVLTGNQPYVSSSAEFWVFCADFNRNYQRVSKEEDLNGEDGGGEVDYGWTEQFISATVDVALFAQNVVIAAESKGLGCCYIGGVRNDLEQVTQLFKLPKRVYPVFGLCIGVPDQDPELKPRLPVNAILHENEYRFSELEHQLLDDYDEHVKRYYDKRTKGRLIQTWSQQMTKQARNETRTYIKDYLLKQGFIDK